MTQHPSVQVELARRILRIAKDVGIKHAIFSGSLDLLAIPGFDQTSFIAPFFQAKLDIEKELQRSGLDFWTILRPAFFMANFLPPKVNFQYGNATETGVFPSGYNADTPIPLVDHQDIAAFAAAAFQNPETFHAKTIDLAGDIIPFGQVLELLSSAAGRRLVGKYFSDAELDQALAEGKPFPKLQACGRGVAQLVDLDQAKVWGVPLHTFHDFLTREADAVKTTYQSVKA
ncbi:hypothetical protein B0T24DRAFT_641479 [Lasiosphaeria ovina]|uniref:NmrA-like domain-containing protein n=1 Tax=Lasiosphaeria ovina TaxID=92902 RepID=A0AAE0MYU7_9PEZI|nr:hypothetical protein B0T24DRAFT_641479 [Lasiosphaeria ovina]